jgi:hypothetical protein
VQVAVPVRATAPALAGVLFARCAIGLPGQPNYRATMTVLNRAMAVVTISSGEGGHVEYDVPACGEATFDDFPVNWWELTSPGRDTFLGPGGVSVSHTYLVVTTATSSSDVRPDPLPPCQGLLQPAPQ